MCECKEGKETVEHFLLKCGRYERERDKLRRDVGVEGMRIAKLLGDPELVRSTITFIEDTRRFKP